jgi:hypothetical protein
VTKALLAIAVLATACAPAGAGVRSQDMPAPIAPQPCLAPAGHADASTSGPAGNVSLQVTFVMPCDLSVRVSGVDLTVRYGAFADVAAARIRSRTGLVAPVLIYDAAVDGPQSGMFTKSLNASAPRALDDLHKAVCDGETAFELISLTGATIAATSVIPSNTGKC